MRSTSADPSYQPGGSHLYASLWLTDVHDNKADAQPVAKNQDLKRDFRTSSESSPNSMRSTSADPSYQPGESHLYASLWLTDVHDNGADAQPVAKNQDLKRDFRTSFESSPNSMRSTSADPSYQPGGTDVKVSLRTYL